jgi:hypothetical protein
LATFEKHPKSPSYLPYYTLTPEACTTLTALLTDLADRKRAKLGTIQIHEWPDDTESAAAEWFLFDPTTEFDLDRREDGITRVKADRIKGREPIRDHMNNLFVTQAARDALVAAKLANFETFWVADTGKYAATQWYHLVPTAFAGRGVDHPWFDPATRGQFKLDRFEEVQPTDDPWKRGVNLFEPRQLRKDPPGAGPELTKLLNLLRDTPIITYKYSYNFVNAPLRLLRKSLPKGADIAYAWRAKPLEKDGLDPTRYSRVCVSKKARQFLLDRRLAAKADFHPLFVLDKPPAGGEVFDGPPAPPIFAPDMVKKMRAAEAKLRAKFDATPKPLAPVKPVPLKPLLAKLKCEIKKRGGEVAPGATAAQVNAAAKSARTKIPARWDEILQTVNGFGLEGCAIFDGEGELRAASGEELPEFHRSRFDLIRLGWPDMPDGYLAIGDSDIGDPIFLDTANATPDGDCPVAWVDHETSQTVHTWPSITLFLKDALEPPGED